MRYPIPPIPIGFSLLLYLAPEQGVHRESRPLAKNIQAGHFDGGDDATVQLPRIGVQISQHPVRDDSVLLGSLAKEVAGQFLNAGYRRFGEAVEAAFTDAF